MDSAVQRVGMVCLRRRELRAVFPRRVVGRSGRLAGLAGWRVWPVWRGRTEGGRMRGGRRRSGVMMEGMMWHGEDGAFTDWQPWWSCEGVDC